MNKLARFTLLVPLVFSLSACSNASQPEPVTPTQPINPNTSTTVQGTNNNVGSDKKTLDLTDPKMLKPAENDIDFMLQAMEYTTEMTLAATSIHVKMKGDVNPSEFKASIQDDITAYNAGIKKALSIPKPVDKLTKSYEQYIDAIKEYEKFPEVLNKALDANDRKLVEEAYAQLNKGAGAYQKFLDDAVKP
ncbi:hypothetical protein [Aneurinibacillus aneurinilyticus]|uniref:hypothetical protein n=1 Tax=Aneurinibacillus aneurinilyticus TaxID=1391 RepID=UPI003671DD27